MDSLALNYAGLVLSDNLIVKAVAVSEIAQMARIEVRMREYLIATWQRRQTKAIKQATSMAKQLKPPSSISAAISKHMADWDEEILPAFLAEVEKTYRLAREVAFKKATRRTKQSLSYPIPERPGVEATGVATEKAAKGAKAVARIRPSFDLADEQAIKALKKQQVLWIGKHYQRRVSPAIAEVTRTTMAEVGRSAAVAGTLMAKRVADTLSHVKVPGGFMGSTPQYFEGLTANAMTVARVHGQIRSFMEIGIVTYSISNPGDKRTCARCAHMDGKVFKVQQGGEQMQRELGAKDPDAVKTAHPWLSLNQIKFISPTGGPMAGKAGATDSKALAGKGQALPPYHFKCRCTVDIGTDSMTYQSLQPLSAPIPGKPIVPIMPKIPVAPKKPGVPLKWKDTAGGRKGWRDGLNAGQREAIHYYTTDEGVQVMRQLQIGINTKGLKPEVQKIYTKAKKHLDAMDKAMLTAPNYEGTAYRGLADLAPNDLAAFKVGGIIDQNAYSSWSIKQGIAGQFANDTYDGTWAVLKVRTSKGMHNIAKLSNNVTEGEVVMTKGKKLRVKKITKVKEPPGVKAAGIVPTNQPGYIIELEEIDDVALPKLKPLAKPKIASGST